jgi:hypothetical protein
MTLYELALDQIKTMLTHQNDNCLLWNNATNEKGYGVVYVNRKPIKVHRFALTLKLNRLLYSNMHAAHLCRNRNCYNPWHLEEKSGTDNEQDKIKDETAPRFRGKIITNTSGFKGVSFRKETQKWEANIWINGKKKYLGSYGTPEDAAKAYDIQAKALWNDCFLNFPD